MYLYLVHRTSVFYDNLKVLHVAPEEWLCRIISASPNIQYLTADLYKKNVDVKIDIADTKLPSSSYDVVICNHVLEHILDDLKAMREIWRILTSDGWAILQVPYIKSREKSFEDSSITTESGREQTFGQADHVRIYALEDYIQRLTSVGFAVELFLWSEKESEQRRYGLNPNEKLIVCRKQRD